MEKEKVTYNTASRDITKMLNTLSKELSSKCTKPEVSNYLANMYCKAYSKLNRTVIGSNDNFTIKNSILIDNILNIEIVYSRDNIFKYTFNIWFSVDKEDLVQITYTIKYNNGKYNVPICEINKFVNKLNPTKSIDILYNFVDTIKGYILTNSNNISNIYSYNIKCSKENTVCKPNTKDSNSNKKNKDTKKKDKLKEAIKDIIGDVDTTIIDKDTLFYNGHISFNNYIFIV